MATAMKTASSVKYAKISRILSAIGAYTRACDDALALFGPNVLERNTKTVKSRNCLVLFSNDRGFCGGFNGELLRFFEAQMAEESEKPLLFVQGSKGLSFCKDKGFEFEKLTISDVPAYAEAEALTQKLFGIYASGEAANIDLVYQRFDNMMTQTPVRETVLPHDRKDPSAEHHDMLFLPDRDSAQKSPAMYCLINSIYRIMLEHTAGAQAATSIAMRSACDNADKSLAKLEILINRIRQAEVTNSVIETSSYIQSDM